MINRIIRKIRRHICPTIQDRWRADKGDETLRLDYPLTKESIVLDFGGFEGQCAADIYGRFGCKVVVFEPVSAFAEKIRTRFVGNSQIEVCSFALGNGDREEKICLSADASSMHSSGTDFEPIEIRDAVKWLNERSSTRVSLAKINIEGGEYELLERLIDGHAIELIDFIQIQFHPIAPDSRARMEAIQKSLAKTHSLQWQYDFVWESWGLKQIVSQSLSTEQ